MNSRQLKVADQLIKEYLELKIGTVEDSKILFAYWETLSNDKAEIELNKLEKTIYDLQREEERRSYDYWDENTGYGGWPAPW